jgi:FixJ family two-component response regulator
MQILMSSRLVTAPQPVSANRAEQSSRVACVASDDEQLTVEVRKAVEGRGITVRHFRSAFDYLACERPDIETCLLIGRNLTDMTGLELQRMVVKMHGPPIVFVSAERDIPSCVRAIKGGALDFLTLPFADAHLIDVMEIAFKKDQALLAARLREDDLYRRWQSLTSREAEVMRYVVAGFLNKQTAAELSITENTVQVHRGRVMRKMEADSFAALVRMSLRLEGGKGRLPARVPPGEGWMQSPVA